MKLHLLKTAASALAASGLLTPTILCAQTSETIDSSEAALVVIDGYGLADDNEYLEDGVLKVTSREDALIGVRAVMKDDIAGVSPDHTLNVNLTGQDTVGVRIEEGVEFTLWQDAEVRAQTAVQGTGTLYLQSYETLNTVSLTGALDMREGSVVNGFEQREYLIDGSDLHYAGIGELGAYSAHAGSLTVGEAAGDRRETFLRVGTLSLAAGTSVTVDGTPSTDETFVGDNHTLVVGSLEHLVPDMVGVQAAGVATLTVMGKGTLVIGTSVAEIENSQEARDRVYALVTEGKLAGDNTDRATLITSADPALGADFSVVVGKGVSADQAAGAGIHLGEESRWVVYFDDEDKKDVVDGTVTLAQATGLERTTVSAGEDAELILYNWNGQAFDVGDFAAENVHAVGGARVQVQDGVATRLWCKDFAGLKAASIVGHVETADNTDLVKVLPGYRFIADTFDELKVSAAAYANTVDGALFLPVTSGLAAAGERVAYDVLGTLIAHEHSLFAGKGHWWVQGASSRTDASNFFSGGSGAFGYKADVTGATLGYDFALGKAWIGTAAVSFAGIDTESRGRIESTTGDMTTGSVTLAAARALETSEISVAVSYTRASGEARQYAVGHTLEADTDITFVSAAARWTLKTGDETSVFEPYVQAALTGARFDDAVIDDRSHDGAVSGEAFDTSADNRLWTTLEAGADALTQLRLAQKYSLRPSIGAAVRTSVGQTDWKIKSSLFDGSTESRAAYDSAQTFAASVRAGLILASEGRQKPAAPLWGTSETAERGEDEPYAWQFSVNAEWQAASGGEESLALRLSYWQLF